MTEPEGSYRRTGITRYPEAPRLRDRDDQRDDGRSERERNERAHEREEVRRTGVELTRGLSQLRHPVQDERAEQRLAWRDREPVEICHEFARWAFAASWARVCAPACSSTVSSGSAA